jgi:hypothetical protein
MRFTLQAANLDDLVIGDCDTAYGLRYHDLGSPAPREVIQDAPDFDGTFDSTALEGGRTITAVVQIMPWTFPAESRLKAFTRQAIRSTLLIELEDGTELQATVRGIPFETSADVDELLAGQRVATCQWYVPSGILESAALHEQTILAGAPDADGLEFDPTLEFGPTLEFPAATAPGTGTVTNAGDRAATAVLRAYGPFGGVLSTDNVTIGNETTGLFLVFAGLQVLAGEFLEIDLRAKTIRLNGDAAQSLHSKLVFPGSVWWVLEPGDNVVVFQPETYSGVAQLQIEWRDAWS